MGKPKVGIFGFTGCGGCQPVFDPCKGTLFTESGIKGGDCSSRCSRGGKNDHSGFLGGSHQPGEKAA